MPLIPFVDKELIEETKKRIKQQPRKINEIDNLEEHQFIANCLRIGLSISDLKELTYVDVMKILLLYTQDSKSNKNIATQSDIDKLLG